MSESAMSENLASDLQQHKQQQTQQSSANLQRYVHEHYQHLRSIARARLHKGSPLTLLDSVALVSEAFAKINKQAPTLFKSDEHFLAYMSSTMRSLIVDYVRARSAERRGGALSALTLDTNLAEGIPADANGLVDIDDALLQLAQVDPRLAEIVDMRFFGGFTEEEIAAVRGVSSRTVKRDWEKARLMLAAMLPL